MNKTKNIFAVFINLLGLLSSALYFAGWMYRLAYYGRFDLNVIELNFSFESFILIPIIVLYSEVINLLLTGKLFFVLLFIFSGILFVYLLWKIFSTLFSNAAQSLSNRFEGKPNVVYNFALSFKNFVKRNSLVEGFFITIALFAFFAFFWLKGFLDGYRDSEISTTLLPKITLLSSSNSLSPQLAERNKYRLLLRQEDWIYLVAPPKGKPEGKVEVLMITKGESGDKVILMNEEKNS